MAKFKCPCGGSIIMLFSMEQIKFDRERRIDLYGCTHCHRVWWDAPENSLSQEYVDRSWGLNEL